MKTGKSLVELAQAIENKENAKKDYIAPTQKLVMKDNLKLEMENVGEFETTDHSIRQMASSFHIPMAYVNQMKESNAKALMAENFNYWLQNKPSKKMVRTLEGDCRAFLSDRYRTLDNFDLMHAVLPTFEEKGLY